MKFFIVLALVALASANQYKQSSSYSSYSSGGGGGGSLGGLSAGGSAGGLGGLGLSGGIHYARQVDSAALQGFQAQRHVPITLLIARPVQATAAIGSFGGGSAGFSAGGSSGYSGGSAGYSGGAAVASGGRAHSGGVIEAAVISNRQVQVIDAESTAVDSTPAQVVIPPTVQGVHLEFQSQASPITVSANHIPGQAGAPQESSHEEEAEIIRQTITKPVIHEVNEIITPFRRVNQEVKQVQEEIKQLITTGHREVASAGAGGAAGAAGASAGGASASGSSAGFSAGGSSGLGGGATILALVTDGSAAGLLGGRRSFGGHSGGGITVGGGSIGANAINVGHGGISVGGGNIGADSINVGGRYGGSVQKSSSSSFRSSSSSY